MTTSSSNRGEHFGVRLGRITRAALEARRLEEERLAAIAAKEQREREIREHCAVLVESCCQQAEQAAREAKDFVEVKLPKPSENELMNLEIAKLVVAELTLMQVRAKLSDDDVSDEQSRLSILMTWDIATVDPITDPLEDPQLQLAAFEVNVTPVLTRSLVADGTRLMEQHPCEQCAVRHTGPDAVDESNCFCECHILSGPQQSAAAPKSP